MFQWTRPRMTSWTFPTLYNPEGRELGKHLGEGGGMTLVVNLTLGKW